MLSISRVLSSREHYAQAFEAGLIEILQNRTAGTFILGCANMFQHPEILQKNSKLLGEVFTEIANHYRSCREKNQQPDDSADDIAVMDKIIAIGFEHLEPLQSRQLETDAATYQLSFNQLRSFRPERMSTVKDIHLNTEFNQAGFHFDKVFLKKEIFAEGDYLGRHVSLFYNKFPFVKYHALLVVDKAQHNKQYLAKDYLDYIFRLQTTAQEKVSDLVVTYNSLGAGASVNHLHFQIFLEDGTLPLFSPRFMHNGGAEPYPATCKVFTDVENCWGYVEALHADNVAFNLLFKDKQMYCLPRKPALDKNPDINTAMYGWSEMAGAFNLSNKEVFTRIGVEKIIDTIRSVAK